MRCATAVLLLLMSLLFSAVPVRAENSRELTFGMSAAFTGANGELGIEFYRGFMAYIDAFNAAGGADGWTIKVVPANDGYNPGPCFQNTVRFIKQDAVFALFSYVGTPTTTHILPLLQKFEDENIFLLFPFSGSQPLRTEPFGQYVYNLRASYFDETQGLVDRLVAIGRKRIGVFYQSDAYGRTGWDGVHRALERHGLSLAGEAAYKRGASFSQDFSSEVELLLSSDPDAIIVVGTYASQAAFIRDARNYGYTDPIAGLSFADSDKMLELLVAEGKRVSKKYTGNLINSQVVPSYTDERLPGVRLYRKIMEGYTYEPVARNDEYTPRVYSYVSFEGFLNGVILGEMVKRMADDPRRTRIPQVMNSMQNFDLGIGVNVDFSRNGHQGLDTVYFTTVINGLFQSVDDWEQWRR
ncbi:ABC transporter substrate-binding protein [Pseudodesulfovibrio sp. JC047]|uniref:ABC transporter substrate-binding protein n=1 Tax=Pseudodesulfovibrio sp. JC047 TaxID=2683199 RepID=UPI001EF36201|nr:ABC transporter substrate-binding protein [Pseudodesulfovibrio sp. JC047]